MNSIAQVGNNVGNFIYIDTRKKGYAEEVKESLRDSLDIAMEGGSPLKIQVVNNLLSFEQLISAEFSYVFDDEEIKEGDDDAEMTSDKISLTGQVIMKTVIIEGDDL